MFRVDLCKTGSAAGKSTGHQPGEKCQCIDKLSAAEEECVGTKSTETMPGVRKCQYIYPALQTVAERGPGPYWMLKQEMTSLAHEMKRDTQAPGKRRRRKAKDA